MRIYYAENQVRGRVRFICWVNPGRRRQLYSLLRQIDWVEVREKARLRGLEVVARRLVST